MFLAEGFASNLFQVFTGIIGIGMIAASSAATNQILDVSIDSKMKRTSKRPLVQNAITMSNAIAFAFLLLTVGSFISSTLTIFIVVFNVLDLGFLCFLLYKNFKIYRNTKHCNRRFSWVMPPLLGWVSVTGSIDSLPLLLVLIVFIWTPPHFWALAIDRKEDYKCRGPNDAGN